MLHLANAVKQLGVVMHLVMMTSRLEQEPLKCSQQDTIHATGFYQLVMWRYVLMVDHLFLVLGVIMGYLIVI